MKRRSISVLAVLTTLLFVSAGYSFAAPTQAPPDAGAITIPIHIGSEAQTKNGGLTIIGDLTVGDSGNTSTLAVTGDICLNADCQSSWPAGGGGGNQTSGTATASQNVEFVGGSYGSSLPYYQILTSDGVPIEERKVEASSYYLDTAFSLALTAPGAVTGILDYEVKCWHTQSNYVIDKTPTSDNYTRPDNIDLSITNGQLIMSGTCRQIRDLSYYMVIEAEANVLYQSS